MRGIILILWLIICMSGITARADCYEDLAEESGAAGLVNTIPDAAGEFFEESGIDISDPATVTAISPADVFSEIWRRFKLRLHEPIAILGKILGAVLILSLFEGISPEKKGIAEVLSTVAVLITVGFIAEPISRCFTEAETAIIDGGHFMISYIPVYSGIIAASGSVSASLCYNTVVMLISEAAVQLSSTYLMPMMSLCMALAVVDAMSPAVSLSGLLGGINKLVSVALGFIMTILVGLLSIQSIVGTHADTLGTKTAKYLVSSFVPLVGGAVSDAYSTVLGSLNLLKSGVGSFGVAAIVMTVLPTILSLSAMSLSVMAGQIGAGIFGAKRIETLLKNTLTALSMVLAIIICFSVMLIISTAVVMITATNMG